MSSITMLRSRAEMEAFVRAADLGSFSEASRKLGMTPSALSKFVKRLETRLGIRLLTRTTRKVSLTPDGARFLHRCRRVLEEMDAAEQELLGPGQQPSGQLIMTVGVGFGIHQFLPLLPRFFVRHPLVTVDLRLEDREADLIKEGIDIAVRLVAPHDDRLETFKLCDVKRVLCASRRYLQKFGTPRVPNDLQKHNCIIRNASGARWSFERGQTMVLVRGNVAVDSADAMLRLALMGHGIIRANEMVVGRAMNEKRLVPVLIRSFDPDEKPLHVAYPAGRSKDARIGAMVQFLAESFRPPPWRHRRAGKP